MSLLTDIIKPKDGATPTYLHDCEVCIFLGMAEFEGEIVDLYAHRRKERTEYIVRYSDEPSDYGCMDSGFVAKVGERTQYHQIADLFDEYLETLREEQPYHAEEQFYQNSEHKVGPSFKQFVMAGNAIFTVHNDKGEHYTYRVRKKEQKGTWGTKWFVQLLTGPNNRSDYQYLGVLEPNSGTIRTTRASKLPPSSIPMKVVNWALGRIVWPKRWDKLPNGYGIIHEGRCGRCGRLLTTPESVSIGIGPECLGKLGF